jgi:hypothetical protein
MRFRDGAAVLLLLLSTTSFLHAQATPTKPAPPPHPCQSDHYHKLDFWAGIWDVYDNHDGTGERHRCG